MPAHVSMPQQRRREHDLITVHFARASGPRVSAHAEPGARLLEVAQAAGMPLEGTCEGQMACSTCHVVVAPEWFGKLPAASADEEDMLDLASDVTATSRLSCQILLNEDLDGLTVQIPSTFRDMQVG